MSLTGKRQRILIVDDVAMNRSILGEALEDRYEVLYAEDGETALEIAMEDEGPDLILLDIILPGMNGYDVMSRLKSNMRTQNVPVIFITVKGEEEHEQRGLDLGAVDYISKPFSLPIVQARVRTHLELKRHRDTLEDLSTQDGLTGIPNRRRFDEVFEKEFRRAQRENTSIGLVLVDIDYFKAYNDRYGHLAGDDCLRQVAQKLSASCKRPTDFSARYGGEEFVVVLPSTDAAGACNVSECMRKNIEKLGIPHDRSPHGSVTASLGVAVMEPQLGDEPHNLFSLADKRLYEAKAAGRNQCMAEERVTGSDC